MPRFENILDKAKLAENVKESIQLENIQALQELNDPNFDDLHEDKLAKG